MHFNFCMLTIYSELLKSRKQFPPYNKPSTSSALNQTHLRNDDITSHDWATPNKFPVSCPGNGFLIHAMIRTTNSYPQNH